MEPGIYPKAINAYFGAPLGDIVAVHLVKNLTNSDTFTDITTTKSIANIAIAPEDMSVQTIDGSPTLLINAKSNLAKTGKSEQLHLGTATSGSLTTIGQTGAGWGIDAFANKVVHIIDGTGNGQSAKVLSNTADTLTLKPVFVGFNRGVEINEPALSVAPDGTSKFEILDDVWAVYVSATEKVHWTDESTDTAIDAANANTVSIGAASLGLPKLVNY